MIKRRHIPLVLILLLASVLLTGCPPQDYKVMDERQTEGEKTTETLRADNCNGDEALVQDMPVQKSFRSTIQINTEPGETLDESVIREKILVAYGIDDLENDKVCVLPVDVPSGNLYEYDIEWVEIWREGRIETDPGGEKAGTYRILVDMTCQTIGWRVGKCNP
jgi:hypothetical protein